MAKIHSLRPKSTIALRQRKTGLLRLLVPPPNVIRASIVERFATCGKPSCRCHRGQKHGPYYYLTQCVAKGQVRKFLLKTSQTLETAREAVTAFNQFYDTLEELSQINAELLRRGDLSTDRPPESPLPVLAPLRERI